MQTPRDTPHAHVLGALLGRGAPDLVGEVDVPLVPSRVMLAGPDDWTPGENEVIGRLDLRRAGSAALADTSAPVLDWIAGEGIARLAVHFDVDVLDAGTFGPILFNGPDRPAGFLSGVPRRRMSPGQVARLPRDVAAACDLVGLAMAEYLPWEAISTRSLLRQLPLPGGWRLAARRRGGAALPRSSGLAGRRRVDRRRPVRGPRTPSWS